MLVGKISDCLHFFQSIWLYQLFKIKIPVVMEAPSGNLHFYVQNNWSIIRNPYFFTCSELYTLTYITNTQLCKMKSETKQHQETTIEYNTLAIPLIPPPSKLTFVNMSWEVDIENKTFLTCIPCHSPKLSQWILLDIPREVLMFNIKCTYLKIFNTILDFDLEWYNVVKMQHKHNIAIATYSRITIQKMVFISSLCMLIDMVLGIPTHP